MIRLASIVGVAAVATLVLLSGCESPMKTDYAKKLEGAWTNGPGPATISNPQQGAQPAEIPVMRTVTAKITRTGMNKGSFSVTVSDAVDPPLNQPPLADPLVTMASGSFEVDGTKITATISADGIMLPLGQSLPQDKLALLAGSPELQYALSDNDKKLDLSGVVLVALAVTTSPTEKLTLTK